MKVQSKRLVLAALGLALVADGSFVRADVPRLIHFQGRLSTSDGAFLPGPVTLRARLYDHPTQASPIFFDETHGGVNIDKGLFSILIGSQTPGGVADAALAAGDVYLGVSVEGAAELSPRTRIASAPFSAKARAAESLVRPNTFSPAVSVDALGKVGVGTPAPDGSASFEIASTTGGFLPPRMSSAQRDAIANPATGLMVFNTDTACIDMWTGATWKQSCFDCSFQPPTAGNNGPICEGATLNLTATTVPGATYEWTGPNGFNSASQNPSISNATAAASGTYTVTATLGGCTSNPVTTLASVNATPGTPMVGSNSPLCASQSLNLTASTIAGAAYLWAGPNGFTSSQQNPSIGNVSPADAGTYSCTAIVNGCPGVAGSTSVSIGQIPATPEAINGPSSFCSGQAGVTFSIADVPGATSYTWSLPTGATVTNGQGTAFATVTFGSTAGNVTVTANNSCGSSPPATLAVTRLDSPAMPGTISGQSAVCAGVSGVVYTIAAVPTSTSYAWTVPTGSTITFGQGTTSITVTFGSQSGSIAVVATNACGSGPAQTLAVSVNGGNSSTTFSYTGSQQSFTVPPCVTQVRLEVWGAQGQSLGSGTGGQGGYAAADLPVTPGETLNIYVGGQSGFNGGGNGAGNSGGSFGGGASDVRRGGTGLADRLIVGGGGGGGTDENGNSIGGGGGGGSCGSSGGQNYCGGGGGQGYSGQNASAGGLTGGSVPGCPTHGSGGGGGGFQSGGAGGCANNGGATCSASAGSLGQGSNACTGGVNGGCRSGGGGGGFYGGGGAASGNCTGSAGGGGCSWTGSLANQTMNGGVRSGNGQVVISW